MRPICPALMLLSTLGLSACKATQYPVEILFNANQCPQVTQGIYAIRSEAQRAQLSLQLSAVAVAQPIPDLAHPLDPEQTLIMVALGPRPNPGHGLSAQGIHAMLEAGVLTLPLAETQPLPGRMYAQVIVTPCALLKLPSRLNAETIRLLDSDQRDSDANGL